MSPVIVRGKHLLNKQNEGLQTDALYSQKSRFYVYVRYTRLMHVGDALLQIWPTIYVSVLL